MENEGIDCSMITEDLTERQEDFVSLILAVRI